MSVAAKRYQHFELMTDSAGQAIRLGPGGMGTTFRAFDLHLRKPVALKVINSRLIADPVSRRRFFMEARIAAQLDHPNIARVTYLCPDSARECFFAMELVEGESLGQRIARVGPLAPAEALTVLRPLVDALVTLEESRLVHRDIKPDNIMLGSGPRGALRVKLIDFGLAKSADADEHTRAEEATGERFVGSVLFASPEQIRPVGPLDSRSDFYSLGATLWHAITGSPPFGGNTFQVQRGHVNEAPPWDAIPGLTPPLRNLLAKMLAKNRDERPATAAALGQLWDATLAQLLAAETRFMGDGMRAPASIRPSPLAEPSISLSPSPVWQRVEAVPYGSSAPSDSGFLARESEEWLFVRELPPTCPPLLRAEIRAAAAAVLKAPHAGYLNVRHLTGEAIASEWAPGLSAADLLSRVDAPLPPQKVAEWVSSIAAAADWAHARGLTSISLALEHWWIQFEDGGGSVEPLAAASRSSEQWPAQKVRLDALGAYDRILATASGGVFEPILADSSVPSAQLAMFARAACILLGGEHPTFHEDFASLLANRPSLAELLRETIAGGAEFVSFAHWSGLFSAALESADNFAASEDGEAEKEATRANRNERGPVESIAERNARGPHVLWFTFAVCAISLALIAAALVSLGMSFFHRAGGGGPTGANGGIAPSPAPGTPYAAATPNVLPSVPTPEPIVPVIQAMPLGGSRAAEPNEASKARPFQNSLGMRFVPVPGGANGAAAVLMSVYETRVSDLQKWVKQSKWHPETFQAGDHPAVGMLPADGEAFASWLSRKEHGAGALPKNWSYRLPLSSEWARAARAGASETGGVDFGTRTGPRFAWGDAWPPPSRAGNFADQSTAAVSRGAWRSIPGYHDGFSYTAPVGQFLPDGLGLYDMFGNAAEWCAEDQSWADPSLPGYVLRGGHWLSSEPGDLTLTGVKRPSELQRNSTNGFRLVLARDR